MMDKKHTWLDQHLPWLVPLLCGAVVSLVLWGAKVYRDIDVLRVTVEERAASTKDLMDRLDRRMEGIEGQVVKIADDGAATKELVIRIDATLKAVGRQGDLVINAVTKREVPDNM
jgi:hypothetical protein